MGKTFRRQFAAEKKAEILRRHVFGKVPISDLADEYEAQPSLIYGWQRQLQENMSAALQNGHGASRVLAASASWNPRLVPLRPNCLRKIW